MSEQQEQEHCIVCEQIIATGAPAYESWHDSWAHATNFGCVAALKSRLREQEAELERTRVALAVERRAGALIRNRVIGYELVNGVCPVCDGVCAEDSDQVTHGKGCPMAFAAEAEQEEEEAEAVLSKAP